jgi:SAM-dependent methyltransferase
MTDINDKMRDEWDERATTKAGAIRWITDGYSGGEEAFYALGGAHLMDMLYALSLKGISIPKDAIGCEVGCGIGRMTVLMARRFKWLYATDISQKMIDKAPKIDNVQYIATGTLRDVLEKVDFVLSHLVFQHMPKDEFYRYLDEMYDILKPSGVAHFQMHESDKPEEQGDSTILVRGYTKDELRDKIDESKWEIVSLLEPAGISEVWKFVTLRKRE